MLILAKCKRALARPGVSNLGDVADCALGPWGRRAANVFVFIVQTGVCCCFVDLVSGNLLQVQGFLNREAVMLLLLPLFGAMALLRFVAQLGFLNKLGSVAMTVAVVSGAVSGAKALVSLSTGDVLARAWPRRPVADTVMLASCVFFAFEGLGLVLPVQKEMREPAAFSKVLVLASGCLVFAFLSISITCGIAFRGELETASVIAFLATRTSGMEQVVLEASNLLVTAAVVLTFPLQLLPASEILSQWVQRARAKAHGGANSSASTGAGEGGNVGAGRSAAVPHAGRRRRLPGWVVTRLALVGVCMATSHLVTNVALLVALFGAVGQTGLGMLALVCHLALMRSGTLPWSRGQATLNLLLLTFCLSIMVSGTTMALEDIVAEYARRALTSSRAGR